MDVIICIVKTVLGDLLMMLIGANLLGIIVRGIIPAYKMDDLGNRTLIEDITSTKSIVMTVIITLLSILYYYSLYHFWNSGVVLAAAMVMFTRLPDLLFEIRTGKKVNSKNMPNKGVNIICTVISWTSLPVLWYSLCYIK
jgi:hypothetical protein